MGTLEMVRSDNVMLAMLTTAANAGFEVIDASRDHMTVRSGCLPVKVTWEMCACHGGRIWLSQEETGIHIELSSDEYDEELGIDSPETELAWRIDNELADTVRGFVRYVHVVDEVGSYGDPDRHVRRYFKSADDAARYVFEEGGHDLCSTDEVTHQYPNRNMRLRVTYDGDDAEERGRARRIRFRCERLERRHGDFELDYEFTRTYWVYRKGLA